MSKPKTKGRTIGVQLPLVTDAAIRAAARRAGTSPGIYIARLVTLHLRLKLRESLGEARRG